jgi:hypothetical protein
MFSADINELLEVVVNSEAIMDDLFQILNYPLPLNPIQAAHWSKVLSNLLIRKTKPCIERMKSCDQFCARLVDHAMSNASMMDLLLKLVGIEELPEGKESQPMVWLHQNGVIGMLVEHLSPYYLPDQHFTASSALLDIIAMIQAICVENERMENNLLIKELKSLRVVKRLIGYMLDSHGHYTSSSLVNSLALFVELIRRNSADMHVMFATNQGQEQTDMQNKIDHKIPMDLSALIALLCTSLSEFQSMLQNNCNGTKEKAIPEHSRKVTLGQGRLRLCELLAELLRCAIEEEIMDPSDITAKDPLGEMPNEFLTSLKDTQDGSPKPNGSPVKTSPVKSPKSSKISGLPMDTSPVLSVVVSPVRNKENILKLKGGDLQRALREEFKETKALITCLDLFFFFPWNNLLHGIVYDMILQVFNGPYDKCKEIALHLLREGQLTRRITRAQRQNDYESELPKGVRLGYMGHITLISNVVVGFLEQHEEVRKELADILRAEDWQEYVSRTLREIREKESKPLGGTRPNASLAANMQTSYSYQDEDDEDGDAMEVSGGVSTDQFARYLCQQISGELPDRFGYTPEDDEDGDNDGDWGEYVFFFLFS